MDLLNLGSFNSDSLVIGSDDGKILYEKNEDIIVNVRSLAKTVLALGCGILIDKSGGDFNEDSLVLDLIGDKVSIKNKANIKHLKSLKIRHCLSHTIGYRDILLMSKDIKKENEDDLVNYLINYPIYYKPGEYFLYSNAGYFLLAACMEEYLSYPLMDFLYEYLFKILKIPRPRWDRISSYVFGSSRLYLRAYDLYKLGLLLINEGRVKNIEVVSASWIKKMEETLYKHRSDNKVPGILNKDSYGYGIWTSREGIKYSSGTNGQFIILLKKEGIIIVTANDLKFKNPHKTRDDLINLISEIKGGKYEL